MFGTIPCRKLEKGKVRFPGQSNQRARWAKARKESQPVVAIAKNEGAVQVKRTMSAAARRKIAAFQRIRWAKLKSQQKKAA
jgi:hypothetical protein